MTTTAYPTSTITSVLGILASHMVFVPMDIIQEDDMPKNVPQFVFLTWSLKAQFKWQYEQKIRNPQAYAILKRSFSTSLENLGGWQLISQKAWCCRALENSCFSLICKHRCEDFPSPQIINYFWIKRQNFPFSLTHWTPIGTHSSWVTIN